MSSLVKQRGVAMLEFAITIVPMVLIVFGITEFGRAMFQYNTLAKAARDAARYLSVHAPGDAVANANATDLAVYGMINPPTGTPALVSGLTAAMVSVCDAVSCPATHLAQGAAPVIDLVTVTIGGPPNPYTFDSVIPFVVPDFDFGPISVTMKQVL
jgi:hypothetical protein